MSKAKKSKKIVCRNFEGKKTSVPVEKLSFRPSAYGVILKGNKVLLMQQWDGYDFPGGGVDIGETLEEAMEREVWEETGLTVKADKLIDVKTDFFITLFSERPVHSFLFHYLCKDIRGRISLANLEEMERTFVHAAEWVDLERINKIKFYNAVDSIALIKKAFELKNDKS